MGTWGRLMPREDDNPGAGGGGGEPVEEETIFDKILRKEIPSDCVYEDEQAFAFRDISPQGPTHILVIPKNKDGLTGISQMREDQKGVVGHCMYVARLVAEQEKLENGYRLVINEGPEGCQTVSHLHIHVIGGRQMKWPPG